MAAIYSNVDLSETRSMWSIIDLAPLDEEVDEKQENADTLIEALENYGFTELAIAVREYNQRLRNEILFSFRDLPRCVFQGDLNSSNLLHQEGHFAGLIDFNMSGTDVNINVFVNETSCFITTEEFDDMSISEIISRIDNEQKKLFDIILEEYQLNETEQRLLPYFKKICDLFQYPNVCALVYWMKYEERRDKVVSLIWKMIR